MLHFIYSVRGYELVCGAICQAPMLESELQNLNTYQHGNEHSGFDMVVILSQKYSCRLPDYHMA